MELSIDRILESVIAQAPAVAVLVWWLHRRLKRVEKLLRLGSDPPPPPSTILPPEPEA